MKIVVILPTYNEKDNIVPLLRALQAVFPLVPHEMNILVVDDTSPDGTADLVRAECEKAGNLFLLTGKKLGLGAAYVRGMKYAIDHLQANVVMEMDADFSHKPEDVPRLLAAIDAGAHIVIGSRYVKGGSVPEDWGVLRKMISKGGNVCARYIADLRAVRDCTAGFRAIRSSIIKRIDLDAIRVHGYAFQITLLHHALVHGAVVREVPVEFIDRKRGQTKLGLSDIFEFMLNAWWIRYERSRTFLAKSIVGTAGVFVNLASFTLFIQAGVDGLIASPLAIAGSVVSNALFNTVWTFSGRDAKTTAHRRGLTFKRTAGVAFGANYSTFAVLSVVNPGGAPLIHQAIGIVPVVLINYFISSSWSGSNDHASDISAGP